MKKKIVTLMFGLLLASSLIGCGERGIDAIVDIENVENIEDSKEEAINPEFKEAIKDAVKEAADSNTEVLNADSQIDFDGYPFPPIESFDGDNYYICKVLYYDDVDSKLVCLADMHNDSGCDGGSYGDELSVVVCDNVLTVYKTKFCTTSDNGYTTKYEVAVNDDFENLIVKQCIFNKRADEAYNIISNAISEEPSTVVSNGMTDSESRNLDGSYKWYDEFESLYKEPTTYEFSVDFIDTTGCIFGVKEESSSISYKCVENRMDAMDDLIHNLGVLHIYKINNDTVTYFEYGINESNVRCVNSLKQCLLDEDYKSLHNQIAALYDDALQFNIADGFKPVIMSLNEFEESYQEKVDRLINAN